eukprot:SAG31_NODE_33339_length_345_cov_0.528455_1_plen_68_part_01
MTVHTKSSVATLGANRIELRGDEVIRAPVPSVICDRGGLPLGRFAFYREHVVRSGEGARVCRAVQVVF